MPHNNNGFNHMLTTSRGEKLARYARGLNLIVTAAYSDYIELDITTTYPTYGRQTDQAIVFDFKTLRDYAAIHEGDDGRYADGTPIRTTEPTP